jgi:hypothetical protein
MKHDYSEETAKVFPAKIDLSRLLTLKAFAKSKNMNVEDLYRVIDAGRCNIIEHCNKKFIYLNN